MNSAKLVRGSLALLGFTFAGYLAACATSGHEELDEEEVGEVQQAVAAGGFCALNGQGGSNCDAGLTCCSSPPFGLRVCRNLMSDVSNCGTCGHACTAVPPPHMVNACFSGSCGLQCAAGWGDCSTYWGGCETQLNTLTNCGGCGTTCQLNHASESCSTGACQIVQCDANWGNCDQNASNGCEAALLTDSQNCGSCGHNCGAGSNCVSGQCTTPKPDLVVTKIEPVQVTPTSVSVWVTVKNQGGAPADLFEVNVLLPETNFSGWHDVAGAPLSPGMSHVIMPPPFGGGWTLNQLYTYGSTWTVTIDVDNVVDESNEANNVSTCTNNGQVCQWP